MLFPLHNSSSFQSKLNVCAKKYRKRRELTVKGKLKDSLGARGIFFQGWRERSGQWSTVDLESRCVLSDLEKNIPLAPRVAKRHMKKTTQFVFKTPILS